MAGNRMGAARVVQFQGRCVGRRELTTRQAAALLGMSEASVKRWCDGGGIPCRRHGKARRFALADLIQALRGRDPTPAQVASALEAGRVDACAAQIAERWVEGASLASCFDTLLASSIDARGLPALMSRLQALADSEDFTHRPSAAVLGPESGARETGALAAAAVVLRAVGFQPLATPAGTSAAELAAIALRASAAVIVLAAALPDGERLAASEAFARHPIPVLLLDPVACRFVELETRLRALPDYQTRTRSGGAR